MSMSVSNDAMQTGIWFSICAAMIADKHRRFADVRIAGEDRKRAGNHADMLVEHVQPG
jgi:hypothetical protein